MYLFSIFENLLFFLDKISFNEFRLRYVMHE